MPLISLSLSAFLINSNDYLTSSEDRNVIDRKFNLAQCHVVKAGNRNLSQFTSAVLLITAVDTLSDKHKHKVDLMEPGQMTSASTLYIRNLN